MSAKCYFDFLVDMKNDQISNYILCHSSGHIFNKLSQIIWKEKLYDSIVNIMGRFQILLVTVKVIFKKIQLNGSQEMVAEIKDNCCCVG